MKLQVYGSHFCKDTLYALNVLSGTGTDYAFIDISGAMRDLKAFLKLRDDHPKLFDTAREQDKIGIPCFVLPDGRVTLELREVL